MLNDFPFKAKCAQCRVEIYPFEIPAMMSHTQMRCGFCRKTYHRKCYKKHYCIRPKPKAKPKAGQRASRWASPMQRHPSPQNRPQIGRRLGI